MRIENILFKIHCFRLKYLTAAVGLIVLVLLQSAMGRHSGPSSSARPCLVFRSLQRPTDGVSLQTQFPRSKFPAVAGSIPPRTGKNAEKIQRMAIAAAGRATNDTPADESVE